MTNVIKLQFVKDDQPQGREYTYYAPDGMELKPGDRVAISISEGEITAVDVPAEEIAPFGDKAKTILGKLLNFGPGIPPIIEGAPGSDMPY